MARGLAANINASQEGRLVIALALADALVAIRVAVAESEAVSKARGSSEDRDAAGDALIERVGFASANGGSSIVPGPLW